MSERVRTVSRLIGKSPNFGYRLGHWRRPSAIGKKKKKSKKYTVVSIHPKFYFYRSVVHVEIIVNYKLMAKVIGFFVLSYESRNTIMRTTDGKARGV